jgi:hypothetical protein
MNRDSVPAEILWDFTAAVTVTATAVEVEAALTEVLRGDAEAEAEKEAVVGRFPFAAAVASAAV